MKKYVKLGDAYLPLLISDDQVIVAANESFVVNSHVEGESVKVSIRLDSFLRGSVVATTTAERMPADCEALSAFLTERHDWEVRRACRTRESQGSFEGPGLVALCSLL